jgi:hypothetical protein
MPIRRSSAFPVPSRVSGCWTLAVFIALAPGCSTAQIDTIPQEIGGLPQGAPARPAEQPAFPAVHDVPASRATSLLDAEQQKKLEADLIAIRNRQPNQQKNIAREKAKAEKKAKELAKKGNKDISKKAGKKIRKPSEQAAGQGTPNPAPTGQAAGAPPWPLPPQTTGGSPRP